MKGKAKKPLQNTELKLELKKHVAVIHSGSNKLSLLQRKIANALLFNAYKDLLTSDEHQIQISSLCNLIGYSSNDHKTIKNALVKLLSTVLQWNLVDGDKLQLEEEGIWNASSIIADASIEGARCTYSYSNKMKKLMYRPNVYGRLDMLVQSKFQSGYGLALYENCNRFQDIGRTPWIDIEKFRLLMGVKKTQYKIFRDFKNRVISKALQEVNKYAPINISAEYRKQGRKVIAIQFIIEKEDGNIVGLPTLINEHSDLHDVLKKTFGFSSRQIENALDKYELNYIHEKIDLILASTSYKNGKIKNLAKYLLSALSDDYQPNKSGAPKKLNIKKVEHTVNSQAEEADYRRYQERELFKIFDRQSNRMKNNVLKAFEKHLTKNIRGLYRDIYDREGIQNVLIQDHLSSFLRNARPEMLTDVPDFDAWKKSKKTKQ